MQRRMRRLFELSWAGKNRHGAMWCCSTPQPRWWPPGRRSDWPKRSPWRPGRLTRVRQRGNWKRWLTSLRKDDGSCSHFSQKKREVGHPRLYLPRRRLLHFDFLQILRHLNVPSQLFRHYVAQLGGGVGLAMNQIRRGRLVAKSPQPFEQLRWIGVVTELLERRDLGADGHEVAVDLNFLGLAVGFVFDGETARPRRLEADEQHQILGLGQPLGQMMQNAPARHHAAGRNDDRRRKHGVNLLRLLRGLGKGETRPLERRTIAANHVASVVAVLFVVLQKNFDRLDRHGAIAEDRQARNLLLLHQVLEDEYE